jgi:hypothetical protein
MCLGVNTMWSVSIVIVWRQRLSEYFIGLKFA